MAKRLDYKAAGVDIDLKERLIPLFRRIARSTTRPEVLDGIGGFGALIKLARFTSVRSPVLVAGTDGVGTKLKIAFATGRHDTVGIDCVAMCVNDIICHAARPLFFLDYIGAGSLDARVARDLVSGIAHGCRQAGMSLVGGETAQMPGIYRRGEYDLVGFAVGLAERARIPSPRAVRAGDLLVGLASSGLHSNGFSLARKVLLERSRLRLDAHIDELGCTLGEELLRPTRIYATVVAALFRRFHLKGLANITGGGIIENLPRALPAGLRAIVHRGSWPVPPIFSIIEQRGRIERIEMDRTFNNGLGMIAIVPPGEAQAMLRYLRTRRQPASIVGEIARGRRGVRLV
ncbi:MAG TPA: phosphoribosylformylglycinamidine cyclo-ligase [Candidatus Binataceae bacterium]|nr:phosphoribosylformylglycinamidine cyclo-ligase [Candidatus Binataceae bacterium]